MHKDQRVHDLPGFLRGDVVSMSWAPCFNCGLPLKDHVDLKCLWDATMFSPSAKEIPSVTQKLRELVAAYCADPLSLGPDFFPEAKDSITLGEMSRLFQKAGHQLGFKIK